jgi:capsular polysaccharide biosynthesis protein
MERAMPQALPSHEMDSPSPSVVDAIPRRPTVGDAMRRWWPLVIIVALVCAGLGAYYAHSRKQEFEATASLSVGLLDLNTQSVPGFATGGEIVASGFSRSVQTDAVIAPAARRLHLAPAEVRARVSSTSVPSSPIFTITATGPSAGVAIAIANAVSRSMVAYGRSHSGSRGSSAALLQRYRSAVEQLNKAKSHLTNLRSSGSSTSTATGAATATGTSTTTGTTATTTASSKSERAKAKAEVEAQQLRVAAIGQLYRNQTGEPQTSAVVQPLVNAESASSDRRSRVELYGAVGALAGLCVGTALAVLLTAWRYRRRLAR